MKKLIVYILLFISAHIAIINGALTKADGSLKYFIAGKHIHFIVFFVVAFLASLILMHKKFKVKYYLQISFIYASILAVVIEILQKSTSYRTSSINDIIWGLIGASSYVVFAKVFFNSELGKKIKHKLN